MAYLSMVRGGQIHVRNVVTGLRNRGHDVHLLDWNSGTGPPHQHSLTPLFRFGIDPARTIFEAVSTGRDIDADVVVSKTRKTYVPGLAAAGKLDIPHVTHVGSSPTPVTDSLLDRLDAASVSLRLRAPHDAYLVVCRALREELATLGIDATRVFDVKNAVDTDRFNPEQPPVSLDEQHLDRLPASGFTIGYVGGIHDYKGVYDLAAALDQTDVDCRVVVAGDGPERERFAAALGNAGVFLGAVPYEQIPALYHRIDALVLPSHTEGIPRVILEAQATATPVVATRVGGVPEVIKSGETGLLCDPHDPESLAAAIDRLVERPDERERIAKDGRAAVVENYTWNRLYDRYEHALKTKVDASND
jgi:glycosyltransferase involved in cell wall biosynthesis